MKPVNDYDRLKEATFDLYMKNAERIYELHNLGIRCECPDCEEFRERLR